MAKFPNKITSPELVALEAAADAAAAAERAAVAALRDARLAFLESECGLAVGVVVRMVTGSHSGDDFLVRRIDITGGTRWVLVTVYGSPRKNDGSFSKAERYLGSGFEFEVVGRE